jgi:hypothetical protein
MSERVCGYQLAVSRWQLGGASITRRAASNMKPARIHISRIGHISPIRGAVLWVVSPPDPRIEDEDEDEYEPLTQC